MFPRKGKRKKVLDLDILRFPPAHHEWLLSDAVDILPFLLLPLAGPEELSDEENEGKEDTTAKWQGGRVA